MGFSTALAALLPLQGDGGGFKPPSVNESFFYDAVGDGSVIASWKIIGLLIIGTVGIMVFFVAAGRRAAVVPSKFQFFAEGLYGFVRNSISIEVLGRAGRSWAPFLATMFMFILVMNIYEIIPVAAIPVTSHFVFPAALAVLVWVLYNVVGVKKHGLVGYLKATCVIPGIPWPMHILLVPLEFLSKILLQPFTLAVRLFANMFAGHMLVVVAGAGTIYLLESGGLNYAFAVLPALASVGLWFFELLICALQAYVFVLLTAIYLESAMADSH
ncbi:MAG: F0F1 ATP synthase subunit A [Nakamurella sp.]